jgi:polysaccharide deacetylase 2 family uncharacterized protein YibQ
MKLKIKNWQLLLWYLLSAISIVLFLYVLVTGIINYSSSVELAESKGQRVLLDINTGKLMSEPVDLSLYPAALKRQQQLEKEIADKAEAEHAAVEAKQKIVPRIAIMVTDLGLSRTTTDNALTLPVKVAMGFSPYAVDVANVIKRARAQSREVFINVPLEPNNYPIDDAGPQALLSGSNDQDNLSRLNSILSAAGNISGVYTNYGEKFSSSPAVKPMLQLLKEKNILLVYGEGGDNDYMNEAVKAANYHFLPVSLLIDQDISPNIISGNLTKLEEMAKTTGLAIGIARPYPLSIKVINQWLGEVGNRGINIVTFKEISDASL